MKVVIINKYENKGGAAIAAKRLFETLNIKKDIDATLLVQESDSTKYQSTTSNFFKKKLNFFRFSLERLLVLKNIKSKENLFFFDSASFGEDISKNHFVKEADIIHLHWTNFGFLSLKSIRSLFLLKKPVFWTLHDMWLLTGGCFHSRTCEKYKNKCENCMFLKQNSKLAFKSFLKKEKILNNPYLKPIAISNWSKKNIENSKLITNKSVVIGNPIDTTFYLPLDKKKTKKKLNLDSKKLFIGFIAFNTTNKYKGGKYLVEALNILKKKNQELFDKIELIAIGRVKDDDFFPKDLNIIFSGYIGDEVLMRDYYNAMDVFTLPSLEENLPLVIQEAMSCGTPVVAFNTGGITDLINHKKDGYLADYKNSEDLANGIMHVLLSKEISQQYAENARKKIMDSFSYDVIAEKLIVEYKKSLL